jgi:hypothetical protein
MSRAGGRGATEWLFGSKGAEKGKRKKKAYRKGRCKTESDGKRDGLASRTY